jgi:hypothetical protein
MKELIKKIIIVNGVFAILFVILVITEIFFRDGSFSLFEIIYSIHMYIYPFFIISMCLFYQYNNKSFSGFSKSLLIPLAYIIFGAISLVTWARIVFEGEAEGFAILFYYIQFGVTFFAVLIINLIYLLIDVMIKRNIVP